MARSDSTHDVDYFSSGVADRPRPGVLLVQSGDAPRCDPIPLDDDGLVLGRGDLAGVVLEDLSMSRKHARITVVDGQFQVEDLGSRNGLVLDGVRVGPRQKADRSGRVVRLGTSVFVLSGDIRPYLARTLERTGDVVCGPVLGAVWEGLDALARTSAVLHLHAESGSGKELAARRFHARGPSPEGPFVAVNCAAIPSGVAERLLFGARKGAFSGATADVEGYFESAHRGTLFLDEVGDLDLDVQAKLLRTIETRQVLPLGGSKARTVDVRLVSATHLDLRRAVASQRFREDLFFRLCRPAVEIPPLRARPEEIAYLAATAAARIDSKVKPSAAFLEACLLREWPGNVRELVLEVEDAARRSAAHERRSLEPEFLDAEAGHRMVGDAADNADAPRSLPADDVIEAALTRAEGKVATAARQLNVHRTQLRRWLANRAAPRS